MTGRTGRSTILVMLLAVTSIAHAPALLATFVYDDRSDVVRNPSAMATTFLERLPGTVRPLLKASYAAQDAVHGMNAFAFHAVNFVLHLIAVALVFLLLDRAVRSAGAVPARAHPVAAVAVLLWSLHPALTETVSYVSGRSMGLSSVLVLAAMLAATGEKPRSGPAFFCAALAPLARETALVAPVLLLAWQATVGRRASLSSQFRRAAPVWAGALVAAAVLVAMPRHRDLVAFSLAQRGPIDSLRANVFAIPEMLGLWIAPWRISILPVQPVIYGWGDAPTLIRIAGLTLMPLAAWVLRRRAPVAALALIWAPIALLPTNSAIWRVDPVAVKPLYLSGIGLSLLLALALTQVRRGLWVAGALALALGVMTFARAQLYRDEVALFADAAENAPQEARAQAMLGLALANAGREAEARAALERALILDPFEAQARNALRLLDAGGLIYTNPAP